MLGDAPRSTPTALPGQLGACTVGAVSKNRWAVNGSEWLNAASHCIRHATAQIICDVSRNSLLARKFGIEIVIGTCVCIAQPRRRNLPQARKGRTAERDTHNLGLPPRQCPPGGLESPPPLLFRVT